MFVVYWIPEQDAHALVLISGRRLINIMLRVSLYEIIIIIIINLTNEAFLNVIVRYSEKNTNHENFIFECTIIA